MVIDENPSFLGDGFFFLNKFPPRYHPTQKETICRGQMLLLGNAACWLLTYHRCAGTTVPRP